MTLPDVQAIPPWAYRAAGSAAVLVGAFLLGRFVARSVCRRLEAWGEATSRPWDELIIEALRRGMPVWSLLIGLYVAAGIWPLPASLAALFTRTLYLLAWLSATVIGAGLAGRLVVLYGSQFQHAMPVTGLTQSITRIVIIVLGLLMILNGLGVSITPLLTALGVGGLAVALALQDTLSNLFAGFYLTVARSIRVGDYIRLEAGEEGYVKDIGWRATQIRMLSNNLVLVPNQKLGQAILTNYHLPDRELAVLAEVTVDYNSDLAQVERVTNEVARDVLQTVPGGVLEFEPFIRYHTFAANGVSFTVILRAKEFVDQYLLKHEFIKRLHARYQQEDILIPSFLRKPPPPHELMLTAHAS